MRIKSTVLCVGIVLCCTYAAKRTFLKIPTTTRSNLDGIWLAQSAESDQQSKLSSAWSSTLSIRSNQFTLSHFCGMTGELKGSLTLSPDSNAIDLFTDAIDMSELSSGMHYPTATLPGIFKLDQDWFTVCFQTGPHPHRPTEFVSHDANTILLTFARTDTHFVDFPKEITVTVLDPSGKPAPGVSILKVMSHMVTPAATMPEWKFPQLATTNANGIAMIPYGDLSSRPLAARDAGRKLIGMAAASPASLQSGAATIRLQPETTVSGTLTCDALHQAGKPMDWTCVYLLYHGQPIGICSSLAGAFEFNLPPGDFTLDAYGDIFRHNLISFTVPPGRPRLDLPPIPLTASNLVGLIGKTAPEFEGLIAWKDAPVKLADLRGKVVLLDFWGYWCGPCVRAMPTLMEIHDKFHDRGLAIVSVHVDIDGEVDTFGKLGERTAETQKMLWNNKPLPFPVALCAGHSLNAADGSSLKITPVDQFGILHYPTTILIDRKGIVVGEFDDLNSDDLQKSIAAIEKLIGTNN